MPNPVGSGNDLHPEESGGRSDAERDLMIRVVARDDGSGRGPRIESGGLLDLIAEIQFGIKNQRLSAISTGTLVKNESEGSGSIGPAKTDVALTQTRSTILERFMIGVKKASLTSSCG